jgi:arylsulfatase A-like enzyme
MSKNNTILIVCDELIAWHNLPKCLTKHLKGYNAFRKLGIEFTNIHNNRQMCSASRASFMSSAINTGVQDNIDQSYQYNVVPKLSNKFDTIGKSLKRNGVQLTSYFGKQHIDSKLSTSSFFLPMFNTNTTGCLKQYGYDSFNTFGDTYYYENVGYFTDNFIFQNIANTNIPNEYIDYIHKNVKYNGVLPFLKARNEDKQSFHMEFHITNPHDTQHFWQNFKNAPKAHQMQYTCPFLKEQLVDASKDDPFYYDEFFPDAFVKNKNLNTNFFDKTYAKYKTTLDSLPFPKSYIEDYVIDPKLNSIFPWYASNYSALSNNFTMPLDSNDIASWKNLINNYYGLVIEADRYIYKIYKQLKKTKMLNNTSVIITSDHGDMMSSHGLKQKGYPFKECVNVPFLVYSPFIQNKLKGTYSSILGSLLDLAPTIEILSNISTPSFEFLGKSLVEYNDIGKLKVRTTNLPVLNIYNSWMSYTTYINFDSWYVLQPELIQQKVVAYPNNLYEYLSPYAMIITKKYKFVRYFTIYELYEYNFLYNLKLKNNSKITLQMIKNNIPQSIQLQFLEDVQQFIDFISNIYSGLNTNYMLYPDIYTSIIKQFPNNSIHLCIFMAMINTYVNNILQNIYIIPGSQSDYNILKRNKQYYFFCYNTKTDPDEITNLCDPNYPQRAIDPIFENLNKNLNDQILKYNATEFLYIIPESITTLFIIALKKNGVKLFTYDKIAQYNYLILNGLNTLDYNNVINI